MRNLLFAFTALLFCSTNVLAVTISDPQRILEATDRYFGHRAFEENYYIGQKAVLEQTVGPDHRIFRLDLVLDSDRPHQIVLRAEGYGYVTAYDKESYEEFNGNPLRAKIASVSSKDERDFIEIESYRDTNFTFVDGSSIPAQEVFASFYLHAPKTTKPMRQPYHFIFASDLPGLARLLYVDAAKLVIQRVQSYSR